MIKMRLPFCYFPEMPHLLFRNPESVDIESGAETHDSGNHVTRQFG